MKKNYIIAFLVVIVAAGVFFYFRERKTSEETQKIRSEAFVKLTEIAKKVPQTGLTQMAAAVEKYHKKNKKYPAQIEDLYPEYIPYQNFIEEIDWHYEARDDNFFLSKTVIQGNQQVVASIDKNKTPQVGTGMEVAAAAKRAKGKKEAEDTAKVTTAPILALKPIETIQPIELPAMETPEPESMIEQPEIVSMVAGEIGHGISSDISRKLLVWRDKNGVLGFGNVIYPHSRNLTIYQDGSWINIKNPEPREPLADTAPSSPGPKKEAASMATEYSGKYLVWKDKKGNIGYGNVQYPPIDNIAYICVNGNWQKVIN
ncbi:MAG: hypothetical protein C4522_21105 [Desulfobacteraceae bacterium]|nr:MAG: hypothetical protein C4522_21105 [Desulfobacteraceae bacterium]